MSSSSRLNRPVVPNILRQHIEDASYLWSHRSSNLWSPLFFREHMQRLDNKLDANLEGLRIAGSQSIERSLKNLMRWQTPEEAFVATYILAHFPEEKASITLEKQLIEKPTLSNGAAAALLWSEPHIIQPLIDRWWFSEHNVLRQAAIPAAIIHPDLDMETFIKQGAKDIFPGVRLKVYRAIGEWCLDHFKQILLEGIKETNIFCRAEAAASLALLGDASAIHHLPEVFQYFKHSRLRRYLLIWSALSTHEQFEAWFVEHRGKMEHYRHLLWALAFRGSPRCLPRLKGFVQHNYEPTLAAYVVSHITGVDLDDAVLLNDVVGDDNDESDVQKNPYDVGLPAPDNDALVAWIEAHHSEYTDEVCYVEGQPLTNTAQKLYCDGTQPQRWQAALHLTLEKKAGMLPSLLQPTLSINL